MSILLNDNLNVAAQKPTDARYGPWASTVAALAGIPAFQRYKGLTVGVLVGGVVNEYWFDDGIADSDLVIKIVAGNNGATGATGQSGEQGSTGATGEVGPSGATGATGEVGPSGATGATGEQGSTGATGQAGEQGSTGATGELGSTGATGEVGPTGSTGATGPKGDTGLGFSVFTTGDTLGDLSLGTNANIGQFGLVKGGEMYVYMGAGAGATGPGDSYNYVSDLTVESLLIGSTGATGQSGEQGSTGATGELGSTGATGEVGPSGATGATGEVGPSGATGATGEVGPSGATGATGEQGSTGATGQAGEQGSTGATGELGSTGATGVAGPSGATGATGEVGPSGATGATGEVGPSGATGATGELGSTGATGVQGPTGASGVSDRYLSTSTTELTIGDGPLADGIQTLTVQTGLSYSINQDITISHPTDITKHMHGFVVSYNSGTGVLVANIVEHAGTGTYSSWTVNLDGAVGAMGSTGATGAAGIDGPTGATGADASNSLYNTSIATQVMSVLVGGAQPALAGDWNDLTITQVLDAILFPTLNPSYTIPTINLSTSQTGTKEIGSTVSQTLNLVGTKNDAGAFTALTISRTGGAGAGTLTTTSSPTIASATDIDDQYGYANPNNPNKTYTLSYNEDYVVVDGTTSWTGKGDYSAGAAKKNNKGDDDTRTALVRNSGTPQAADTNFGADTDSITGIYPYFYGKVSTQPSAADIAGHIQQGTGGSTKVLASANGTVSVTFAATNHYIWLAVPATATLKTKWYNTGINNGDIGNPGDFILAPDAHDVTSPNGYWSGVSYNIYISSGATQTTGAHEFRNS
jgi:hypothetical protein